jgi:hypothetical protein
LIFGLVVAISLGLVFIILLLEIFGLGGKEILIFLVKGAANICTKKIGAKAIGRINLIGKFREILLG